MQNPKDDIFIQLGCMQANIAEANPAGYKESLANMPSIRSLLNSVYSALLKHNLEYAIEDLSQKEKERLWKEALKFGRGALNQKELIELTKALYTIECYLRK